MAGTPFNVSWGDVTGTVALVGSILGIGRAWQRLRTLETQVEKLLGLEQAVTRIDERTRQESESRKDMALKIDRIFERLLDGKVSGRHSRGNAET